jgi:probable HAF family extracellular repeat protein
MRSQLRIVGVTAVVALAMAACGGGSSSSPPAPTVTLTSAVPDVAVNVPFLLMWSSSNATDCAASGAWSGPVATGGTQSVTATRDETYVITCTGRGGAASASVAVRAWSGLPSASISVDRSWVLPTETVRVTWTSVNALRCAGLRGLHGELLPSGSQTSAPLAETTTFEVTCANPNGSYAARAVVNVGVAPIPTATLTSSRYDVPDNGDSGVALEWSSTNATSCVASGAWTGALAPSGSQWVDVTKTAEYAISCAGDAGEATASVTVRSWARPEVSLAAEPAQVPPNSVVRLTWSSRNATECAGGGSWEQTAPPSWSGSLPMSGSAPTMPLTETSSFGISCTNPGYGSARNVTARVVIGVGIPKFNGTILGTFHASDLNDAGDVVGWRGGHVGPGVWSATTAKMWTGGAFSSLPGCPDGQVNYVSCESQALDINNWGHVVGWWREIQGWVVSDQIAFRYEDGVVTLIPSLFRANGINAAGQIVGSILVREGDKLSTHAAVYEDGSVVDLGTLGGVASEALAINDAGVVVGWVETPTGRHAFRYSDGVMADLGTLGGATSAALGINSAGMIVGAADRADGSRHAFLFDGLTMVDLGTLGGDWSEARAINDAGQVVGSSSASSTVSKFRAFVFSDGEMHDLNGYLSAPLLGGSPYGFYQLVNARGINARGQILADPCCALGGYTGLDVVVLLTPLAQ